MDKDAFHIVLTHPVAAGTSQLTPSPGQAGLAQLPFPEPMERRVVEETGGKSDS